MVLLEVAGLTKHFKGITALDGVSFTLSAGELLGVIGPNGAGKTTLLNVINGYIEPDSGFVRFRGVRTDGRPPHQMAKLGIARTYQVPRVFRQMTALENVLVPLFAAGSREYQKIKIALAALELVGLADKAYSIAGSLSGGQQKLLELARALAFNPVFMLLDEPFAGVHPVLTERIINIIKEKNKETGLSCILVSHDIQTTLKLCDRLVAMHEGKIIADGKSEEVTKNINVVESYLGV
ncbi:MAG: ABC transporter ATP-binding protein [Candidatus Caldarchaeum sp.]|uniref:ABC transporter ATP-binding protein n=1 Tax=Caldiarchaeum subterraneum TaxID=311458 RepID=A0A7J3VTS2_CALS0